MVLILVTTTFARTVHEVDTAWSCTLEIHNGGGPAESVSAYALGCGASLQKTSYAPFGPAHGDPVGDPPAPFYTWRGSYIVYTLRVSAPGIGNIKTEEYAVWSQDQWVMDPTVYDYTFEFCPFIVPVTCAVTGLVLHKRRTDATYSTRQSPMDFTDQTAEHAWFADSDATVTISAGSLSVGGAMAGVGSEMQIGASFWWNGSIRSRFPSSNTTYGKVGSISAFGIDADLSLLDLHKPGTGLEPDPINHAGWYRSAPSSGAYLHMFDDGGLVLQRSAPSISAEYGSITIGAPVTLNYIGTYARKWDPDGSSYPSLIVQGEPRTWTGTSPASGTWVHDTWAFGSDYSKTQQYGSWLFDSEWHVLDGGGTCQVTQESRVTNVEDVGASGTIAQNDAQLAIMCQPIDSGIQGDPLWGPWMEISHATSTAIMNPSGIAAWTGTSGVSISSGTYWSVTGTSQSVSRSLNNRYEYRIDWLENHPETENYHNTEFPYILRSARSGETHEAFSDNPNWWNSASGGVDYEDTWNWSEFSYVLVGITAPATGTVTMTVTYTVPTISDPTTTCFEHRYGDEGTFSVSFVERTATYTFDVVPGSNSVQVDLLRPTQHVVPHTEYRMQVVKGVKLSLPSAGEWVLTGFDLVLDTEDTSVVRTHVKRAWDWRGACWFGYGAVTDGKPSLQVDPGYRKIREEWGLQYIQQRVHCPDTELTDELHYAKEFSRLCGEIDWNEGWLCESLSPSTGSHNMDASGTAFAPTLYWWDLQHQDPNPLNGCVVVGHYDWVYGAEHDLYYSCYPRGELSGLAVSEDWSSRIRSQSGVVGAFSKASGASAYSSIGTFDTDSQGWWHSDPVRERAHVYSVGSESDLTVANREYTYVTTTIAEDGWIGHIIADRQGSVWLAKVSPDGNLYVQRLQPGASAWSDSVTVDPASGFPRIALDSQSGRILTTADASGTALWSSESRDTFGRLDDVATIIDGLTQVDIWATLGQLHAVGTSGTDVLYRRTSNVDASVESPAIEMVVCTGVSAPTATSLSVSPADGAVWVLVDDSLHVCRSVGTSFTEVV